MSTVLPPAEPPGSPISVPASVSAGAAPASPARRVGDRAPAWVDELAPGALDAALRLLRARIGAPGTVVLAGHVGPDGDALGAALGLHLALRVAGIRSVPTVGERPLKVPAPLGDLPGVADLVDADGLPPRDQIAALVTLDVSSPDRLGTVAQLAADDVPTLVIDHHASGTDFGDVRLIAPGAAATVQLVAHLIDVLGVPLDRDIATCIYAGLVTDTGRFGHANTDAAVLELAARTLDAGVDHAELTRRLYDTRSLGSLRLIGRALDRLTFVPEVALAHTHLTHEELQAAGTGLEATESLIDMVRSADVAEVALVAKPDPDGTWRVSLRSRGAVDVGALATSFGGGGHAAAAGFSAAGDVEDVVARVIDLLRGR